VGIVIGETFAEFGKAYAHVLTGQQDQNESDPDGNTYSFRQPYFITFSDYSAVKFYQLSLQDICILEGKRFDGFITASSNHIQNLQRRHAAQHSLQWTGFASH
jgi:hypothetical protein